MEKLLCRPLAAGLLKFEDDGPGHVSRVLALEATPQNIQTEYFSDVGAFLPEIDIGMLADSERT
jgi:hypothetical protein